MVRYADDFVILCYSKEDSQKAKLELEELLARRGLKVSEAKTRIRHICEGFDFLGFNIKITPKDGYPIFKVIQQTGDDFVYEYNKSLLLISPSLKSINTFKGRIREAISRSKGRNAHRFIDKLNPIIRGWAQSKIYWHCNRTFHDLDHFLFNSIVRFIKRAHPNKAWYWLKEKYFKHKADQGFNNKWVFFTKIPDKSNPNGHWDLELLQLKWFKPLTHIMIRNLANPFDPSFKEYFSELTSKRMMIKGVSILIKNDQKLMSSQQFSCPVCGDSLFNGEKLHKHHILPRAEGCRDLISNLVILHLTCHNTIHYSFDRDDWRETFMKIKRVSTKRGTGYENIYQEPSGP